ncbi:mas-related G-protein coupled receptor member X4-like [Dryobates pubescens]|uniref:mas-related G-protein coupled receptor member X4-like n=1 Tax=Dryobates pubescens TaxID=118200 RepID=UPI0023B9D192|nr:mas-related G-protein coupled receptor member X4-like [Dryobates pubescens]
MEGTITTVAPLRNLTPEYVDYGKDIDHICFLLLELKAMAVVCMGVSLCGLVGNGLVMQLMDTHGKQNRFTHTITQLAFLDLILLAICFLLMLATLSLPAFCFYESISSYLNVVYFAAVLCQVFGLSSLGLLAALSVERCLDVLFPTWYRHCCPESFSIIVLVMPVGVNILFYFLRILNSTFAGSYAGVIIAICTMFSSLMLVSSLALFIKLQCGSQRRPPGKLNVAVLLSMLFSIALGIPFIVEVSIYLPHSYALFPEITSMTAFLLGSLNSSIKPALYFLMGSCQQCRFQYSFKVAFQRVFEEEATSVNGQVPGDAMVDTSV